MDRALWLAFGCLFAISILFVLRTTIGAQVMPAATAFSTQAPIASAEAPPLAKADRLALPYFDNSQKTIVDRPQETIPDSPQASLVRENATATSSANVSKSVAADREIISWHWHVGSKITKKTAALGSQKDARDRTAAH
jgi:hypothetical protein